MAAKISGGEDEPIAEINIVPFVDIILVILIIFMVTTPFIMKPSIQVNLPQAKSGEDSTPSQLNLAIDAKGQIYLNGEKATIEKLGEVAKDLGSKNPEVQAVIAADKEVPHGQVVEVIDTVKANGIKRFAITIDHK